MSHSQLRYVRRFSEIGIDDVGMVGGKNASLGEMYRELIDEGVKIPNGFATTAEAFRNYLKENDLVDRITRALGELDINDVDALAETAASIRAWIVSGALPAELEAEITTAYEEMGAEYGPNPDVAVRSSATAEDLPDASFAGQQETYLNIRGIHDLLYTCKRVFASLFTARAISYREDKGFDHMSVALSIGVQKMVRSDKGSSGVMFTLDTETGFRGVVFITAAYGLGENVVQGAVNTDEFYVFKPKLDGEHAPIVRRHLGDKALRMVYTKQTETGMATRNIPVARSDRERFAIGDEDVLTLARYAVSIENHYTKKRGTPMPMDIEWAKDGISGELYIVQARPETVHSTRTSTMLVNDVLEERGKILITGKSVGQRIAAGKARVILEAEHMNRLQPGEILVTDMTDPDWEPVMKIAGAIVTNRGGRTCHAAIIARELGIPALVGTGDGTHELHDGQEVTVSCAEGDTGVVFEGLLKYRSEETDVSTIGKPKTRIMLNVANPSRALELAPLPADGVGLARLEFIIGSTIRIHPKALVEYDKQPEDIRDRIDAIIGGYASPQDFFVERIAEGVGTISAAFWPRQVIVRLSDFKSNEYASLIGGEAYEPKEENPMIGFRGASRYRSEAFAESFALECAALKKVREVMGLDNLDIMVPFVRTVGELQSVLEVLASHGLRRGDNGLKIYMMCEIPANAVLAEEFLEHCDGFSIGSNDLTQLTLGVDRDSGLLTGFDERDPAMEKMMGMAIDACKRKGKYVGICGQAPSDFPEITRWLIERGISSISLNPDSVVTMTQVALELEASMERQPETADV